MRMRKQEKESISTPVRLAVSSRDKALILARVAEKAGWLTASAVVRESDPSNPEGVARELAALVGWHLDDPTAAERYREDQARAVIRSCEPELIQLGVIEIRAPHYVRDPTKGPREQGYIGLLAVKDEREIAEDAYQDALKQAEGALNRAYTIAEALGLEAEAAECFAALAAIGRAPARVAEDTEVVPLAK